MTPPRRIVIFAPNWLGDAVMALPAIADLRRAFGSAHLTIAARPPVATLFEAVPDVDAVLPFGGERWWMVASRDVRVIRDGSFDLAVLLPNSFYTAWIARRAAIPERWGYRSDCRGWLLTRAIRRPSSKRHQAEFYQELIGKFDLPSGPLEPLLEIREEWRERAKALLSRSGRTAAMMIAIAPGAAYGLAKRWPPERFAELIRGIQRDLGATCVLIGGSADRSTGVEVERELQRHPGPALPINLIGQTDLPVLLGLLSLCHGCVSNDSGAMHLAAAAGVPVTALFGPTDECATSPLRGRGTSDGNFPIRNPESSPTHRIVSVRVWCRPCMLRECPIDHRCMTRISAALVLRELAAQVGQASP